MLMFQTLARRSDELRGISWRALDCEDVDSTGSSSKFYVKSVFSRHSYCVFATDFQTLWVEDVPADVLETKFDGAFLTMKGPKVVLTSGTPRKLPVKRDE